MTDPPRYPDTDDDSGAGSDGRPEGAPRWVSVLGIAVAIAVVVLIVVLHITGTLGPGAH